MNFKIPLIPQTSPKTIRFPNDLIDDIEKAIRGKDSSFSLFVIEASRHALAELKEDKD